MTCSSPTIPTPISDALPHHAARRIAFHVITGSHKFFLEPIACGHELFDFYWNHPDAPADPVLLMNERWLVRACFKKWPLDKTENFNAYAFVKLLRRHTAADQLKITEILEKVYGYYAT